MRVNGWGKIVQAAWEDLLRHYSNIDQDAFVIMPNHVHGIILTVGAGFKPASTGPANIHGLSEMVRAFKTFSARRINEQRHTPGLTVWQRNYYEHVIRNDESLKRIREYIVNNPLQWALDRENLDIGIGAGLKPAPTEDEPWRL